MNPHERHYKIRVLLLKAQRTWLSSASTEMKAKTLIDIKEKQQPPQQGQTPHVSKT